MHLTFNSTYVEFFLFKGKEMINIPNLLISLGKKGIKGFAKNKFEI